MTACYLSSTHGLMSNAVTRPTNVKFCNWTKILQIQTAGYKNGATVQSLCLSEVQLTTKNKNHNSKEDITQQQTDVPKCIVLVYSFSIGIKGRDSVSIKKILEVVTSLYLQSHKAIIFVPDCFQLQTYTFICSIYCIYCSILQGSICSIHILTVGKHIVVNSGGRREDASPSLRVMLLQSEPLSAAVDPRSPPHCRQRALHRFSSQRAGIHEGFQWSGFKC